MSSVFSKIVSGEVPAWKVAETKDFLAFLDINPVSKGHVLVVPKAETDNLFDLDDDLYVGLMLFAKIVAGAIQKSVDCARVSVAVVGLEVPHAHIHLIPISKTEDFSFANERIKLNDEEFKALADKIGAQV